MPKPSLRPSTLTPAPPTPSRALLAQFLTRPSKWYARSASAPRVSGLAAAGNEISPRASTSSVANGLSGARKPKISRPTDPRPIFGCGGLYGCAGESPSHLGRASLALREGSHRFIHLFFALLLPPIVASSRVGGTIPAETQTCVLRKEGEGAAASISVLSSTCPAPPSHSPRPPRRPAHTQNLHGSRVRERETRDRNGSGGGSPVSISISAPVLAGAGACGGADGSGIAPGHVPTRSHSFTPKLSSRLVNLGGASPVERDGRDGKEKEKHSVGFPFHFGGAQSKPLPPDPASLAPPHIILEPAPEEEDASYNGGHRHCRGQARVTDRVRLRLYQSAHHPRARRPPCMEALQDGGARAEAHLAQAADRAAGVRDLFAVGVVEEPEKEEETDTLAIEDAGAGRGGRGD
ncbi:hypothetical protein DFH08DRAFT_941969 [Mycena albidolilacea]|uniref:Uncharacterized protein n=1 Tax=Mycena albidolilacea TaxID=1033008 RepID=A0AAD6ZFT4_9AGAR|nr:hypothetical protein DFH08DRAFT_941969 [Mycena albidolilacea]